MKLKITILNSLLMSLIVCFILCFMVYVSDFVIVSSGENQLKFIVHENAEEVDWDDGALDLDDIEFYENSISTLIYSVDGYHLAGSKEDHGLFSSIPLQNMKVSSVSVDKVDYLLYDFLVESRKHDDVFIRGILSVTEISQTVNMIFFITLITLPLFILISAVGSYLITKISMKPLTKMIETAEMISQGEDLSLRIQLGSGRDEVHKLGDTFDVMFTKLEELFLAEKQFSSDVSHELRTPTAVILAECECHLHENTTAEEKQEALEVIEKQGKIMQQLISALLNLVRLDNGVEKIDLANEDLSELLTVICEEQLHLLPEKSRLLTEIPENIHCALDYSLMIRVISNLIHNGFKYGKSGGFVKVTLENQKEKVLISVSDDGIGIGEEHIGKIFHRFYQVDTARTEEKEVGMGLGLSMVERIVKLHHGEIFVESELGKGTTFHILLKKEVI